MLYIQMCLSTLARYLFNSSCYQRITHFVSIHRKDFQFIADEMRSDPHRAVADVASTPLLQIHTQSPLNIFKVFSPARGSAGITFIDSVPSLVRVCLWITGINVLQCIMFICGFAKKRHCYCLF